MLLYLYVDVRPEFENLLKFRLKKPIYIQSISVVNYFTNLLIVIHDYRLQTALTLSVDIFYC